MQILKLKLSELTPNTGQIPGLPSNPRQWTKGDVDKIAKSLKETPELFEARPIIAVMYQGQKVILGGNLRYEGARKNKDKEAPVILFPENTPVEKMKEIVVKDNSSMGSWDVDALANEWDNLPLEDWGVPSWVVGNHEGSVDIDGLFDPNKEAPVKAKPTILQVSIPVGMEDKIEDIRAALLVTCAEWEGVQIV